MIKMVFYSFVLEVIVTATQEREASIKNKLRIIKVMNNYFPYS